MTQTQRPPRRTQAERSAATQERLLNATIEALVEDGYADASTTVIAERAGVSRGAQLHHFRTKADLVDAAIGHLSDQIGRSLIESADELEDEPDRVAAAVRVIWQHFDSPLFQAFLELMTAARTEPELRSKLRTLDQRIRRSVRHRTTALFGETAKALPGFDLAIEMTYDLMLGLALRRALDGASERSTRSELEAEIIDRWSALLPGLLDG